MLNFEVDMIVQEHNEGEAHKQDDEIPDFDIHNRNNVINLIVYIKAIKIQR